MPKSGRDEEGRCVTAEMLNEILHDYIRQNEEDPMCRKARIKAAKRMLGD